MKVGGLFTAIRTTVNGLSHQMKRMEIISENIAHAEKSPDGKGNVYQRKVLQSKSKKSTYSKRFSEELGLRLSRSHSHHMPSKAVSEIQKTLQRIGLSNNEAKIYLMLLQEGINKAGKISKKTQINRTTTYDTLRRLLNKGLLSYVVKANRKYFRVVDPERLVEFIQHKEDEAKKILPFLKKIHKKPAEKGNVTLYYGYKGIKSIFQDIAKGSKMSTPRKKAWVAPGKAPASPAPNKKRRTSIWIPFRTAPVRAVNMLHTETTIVSALRGPSLSAIHPEGT